MTNPGIPTNASHPSLQDVLVQAAALFEQCELVAGAKRTEMAAGAVGDDVVNETWVFFASAEAQLKDFRKNANFHDAYARFKGLSYRFNCTDDVNAGNDRIINLPDNHKFKADHRVEFIIQNGALPTNLSEGTNYWVRDLQLNALGVTTSEGGASNVNLTNATGTAEMLVNIRPDYNQLLTAVDAVLDEIELNLTQRAPSYDRANLGFTYSTRSTVETATLRTKLQDVENLIDIVSA